MEHDNENNENMADDANVSDESQHFSHKQRVLDNQGKQVPVYLFLYSCFEFERTSRSMEAGGAERLEWPVTGGEREALPEEMENLPLALILKKLIAWYCQEFRELSNPQPIDHERLGGVVEPLVALNRDLGKIYRLKTGEDLPEYESSVGNNRAWDDIYTEIRDQFPTYQHLYNRYIQWSHAAEPVEIFEAGSRPPVGRYAPPPIRRTSGPGGSRGGRDDRGSRPPRREANFNGNSERFDRGPGPRGKRGDANGNSRFEARPPRHDGQRGGRGAPRVRDEAESAKLEDAAIRDVNEAIKTLKNNQDLGEVLLKPTNSFYRRLQHQCVVEAGFNSTSIGEGPERAVKVGRK